jgi:DNA polymerase I-like protein with 3'-5' exonuclease and polymerase domains
MVAQTADLPNIRKMFVPDYDHIIIEGDLEKADAQVVAWDAGDEPLKALFRRHGNLHKENALDIYGGPVIEPGKPGYHFWFSKYHRAKAGVHATDYGAKPKRLAEVLECSVADATTFQTNWFRKHPAIKRWHEQTEMDLMLRRCVENRFGYKRHYFDRIEGLLPEALAWKGQSTVAIVINKIVVRLDTTIRQLELLLQVHDSFLGQVHKKYFCRSFLEDITEASKIVVPYDDPLIIPCNLSYSPISWGDVKKWDASEEITELDTGVPTLH